MASNQGTWWIEPCGRIPTRLTTNVDSDDQHGQALALLIHQQKRVTHLLFDVTTITRPIWLAVRRLNRSCLTALDPEADEIEDVADPSNGSDFFYATPTTDVEFKATLKQITRHGLFIICSEIEKDKHDIRKSFYEAEVKVQTLESEMPGWTAEDLAAFRSKAMIESELAFRVGLNSVKKLTKRLARLSLFGERQQQMFEEDGLTYRTHVRHLIFNACAENQGGRMGDEETSTFLGMYETAFIAQVLKSKLPELKKMERSFREAMERVEQGKVGVNPDLSQLEASGQTSADDTQGLVKREALDQGDVDGKQGSDHQMANA